MLQDLRDFLGQLAERPCEWISLHAADADVCGEDDPDACQPCRAKQHLRQLDCLEGIVDLPERLEQLARMAATPLVAIDPRALLLLQQVETEGINSWGMELRGCPVCGGLAREIARGKVSGYVAVYHQPDCALAAFLREHGGVLQERRAQDRRRRIDQRKEEA
jgi:hypothetical protein